MNKLGVEDVEEWISLTDKDGVVVKSCRSDDVDIIYFSVRHNQLRRVQVGLSRDKHVGYLMAVSLYNIHNSTISNT